MAASLTAENNATNWSCMCHRLNLAVNDAFKGASSPRKVRARQLTPAAIDMLNNVHDTVTWYRASSIRDEQLWRLQLEAQVEPKKLVTHCATRWNSEYLMLDRFLELQPYVTKATKKYHDEGASCCCSGTDLQVRQGEYLATGDQRQGMERPCDAVRGAQAAPPGDACP